MTRRFRPEPEQLAYTFGGHDPVLTVTPGEVLEVWSQDCFGGCVYSTEDLPSRVCEFPFLNPVTGPFHIDGAEPGDTLAVHFVSMVPAVAEGWSSTFPHFGALTTTHTTPMLHPPLEERVWRYAIDVDREIVTYQARRSDFSVELPLEPMHGTAGVAPAAGEARSTLVADAHGGNMDTPELRPGTTLYLGVNVPGALFALGDGHARQGQGELCGVAVECAMTTRLVFEVIKGVRTPVPRLEDDDHLMSVGAARPLEDAYRIACHDLVTHIADLTGLDLLDAYQLVSQAGLAPVGNVCDPNYTIAAKIAKAHVPGAVAYGDAHRRLRAIAAAAMAGTGR